MLNTALIAPSIISFIMTFHVIQQMPRITSRSHFCLLDGSSRRIICGQASNVSGNG